MSYSSRIVIVGATYLHYRGSMYKVIKVHPQLDEGQNLEDLIVIYENVETKEIWARSAISFLSTLNFEGTLMCRFSLVFPGTAHA